MAVCTLRPYNLRPKALQEPTQAAGRFVRDLFTGELQEVPYGEGGRQIIARETVKYAPRRLGNPWDRGKDHISRPLSLMPEEATPERIKAENEAAKAHNTGAWYDSNGLCHLGTRGMRVREMRRKEKIDNDGCYGDG
jgi:hypothetical protein